jgi:Tfp pilus assembly protein PilO
VSRRHLMIGAAAGVGVLLFWFVFLWGPQGSKLSKARDRRDAALQEQQDLQVRIDRLKSLQAAEPQKRAQLESLRVAIPDEPNLAQFILDANTAANVSGIDFLSISPSPPATSGGPGGAAGAAANPATPSAAPAMINLSLSVSGGYFQIVDFVNRLDALSRLVVIDSLSLTTGGQSTPGSTGLNVAITARMFVRTATPVAGSTATATPGSSSTSTTTTTAPATTSTTAP